MSILISVGTVYSGVKFISGEYSAYLALLAQEHANYMARYRRQGHQNFQERYDKIKRNIGLRATEICAETWSWQKDSPNFDVAWEMYYCWERSTGHWSVVSEPHAAYGDGLALGGNIWYSCILVGD